MAISQLRVKNWTEFQHYKDRNPPWIKLHFALLASEDWVTLDDASRLLAVVCMLIASRNNGMVPNNPAYLKRVAYLDKLPKLNPLIECGFLEIPLADASTAQADAITPQADARPEERRGETDKKESLSEPSSDDSPPKKKKHSYSAPFEAFWQTYPTTPNMSKLTTAKAWDKLDADDQRACSEAVAPYRAFLASKPDHLVMHAATFINERRFDGFAEQASVGAQRAVSDDDWQKRLIYGRKNRAWHVENWGPFPGADGCRVPPGLLQPEDGQGWVVWDA